MAIYQVIKTVQIKRALTGEQETFTVVQGTEMFCVRGRQIQSTHIYWVPAGEDVADEENYLAPVDDPDYNLQLDFQIYREKYGVLMPAEVKKIREDYQLSLRQYALILGISYSTLSEIENGLILQSDEQESLFQLSRNRVAFKNLIVAKEAVMSARQFQRIQDKIAQL